MFTIGKFDYHRNCSIPHHIPAGIEQDGNPVIVFPKNNKDIVVGRSYRFIMLMTREATYTIDGKTYRVAHAACPEEIHNAEGDVVDSIIYARDNKAQRSTLADAVGSDVLRALKAQLGG